MAKFKVGQIVQNIKTGGIYRIIPDYGSCEQTIQKRVLDVEVASENYTLYKGKKPNKALREYLNGIKEDIGS